MSVCGALVRRDGNDRRVGRVGDIVDGQGIFVVGVADITAQVLLIRTLVLEALGLYNHYSSAIFTREFRTRE